MRPISCRLLRSGMSEEIPHHSTRGKRRRRHKSSVTNINIFAMTSSPEMATEPATPAPVPAPPPVPPAEHEDEDLFGERLVSSEWLERRAKRLENQEQELKQRALDIERREAELDEREARFEADMYLREDEGDEGRKTLRT